jgi:Mn2+/Fe2+ NRAMP family transporter
LFSDAFAEAGLLDYANLQQRRRWIAVFAWFFPLAWTVFGVTFKAPVAMVMAGGVANAFLLLLVVFAAYIFRYHRLAPDLKPGRLYDVLLWISLSSVAGVGVMAILTLF